MKTVNKQSYVKRLSDYTFAITAYNNHTFNNRCYYFDHVDKRFYVKCLKWIDDECYNYKKINLRFDAQGYPFVIMLNDKGKYAHLYLERFFREVLNTDSYEVKL